MKLSLGQTKILADFFSNLAVAWFIVAFVAPTILGIAQISGVLNGSASLTIALLLAKNI